MRTRTKSIKLSIAAGLIAVFGLSACTSSAPDPTPSTVNPSSSNTQEVTNPNIALVQEELLAAEDYSLLESSAEFKDELLTGIISNLNNPYSLYLLGEYEGEILLSDYSNMVLLNKVKKVDLALQKCSIDSDLGKLIPIKKGLQTQAQQSSLGYLNELVNDFFKSSVSYSESTRSYKNINGLYLQVDANSIYLGESSNANQLQPIIYLELIKKDTTYDKLELGTQELNEIWDLMATYNLYPDDLFIYDYNENSLSVWNSYENGGCERSGL